MPQALAEILHAIGIADPQGWGWRSVVLTFLIAATVTWRFTPTVRRFALKAGWADAPGGRRRHQGPLPNAGGLAVYAGVVLALITAFLLRPTLLDDVLVKILSILLGGSLLVLVGFIDDQFELTPRFRLVAQTVAALVLYAAGVRIEAAFSYPIDPVLSLLLTLFWVVGITNAMNLIDGVDGLAGGVAFIAAMGLLAASAQFESRAAATLILAGLAGAALGFLRHNLPPSKIIMGDAGAYFFGYTLAAASIMGNVKITTAFALVPVALFLLVPIADTTWVVIRRVRRGQNPLATPGRDHIHHWLLDHGLSNLAVVIVLWSITLAASLLALWLQKISSAAIAATALASVLALGFVLWRRKLGEKR